MGADTTLTKETVIQATERDQTIKEEILWNGVGADTAIVFVTNAQDQLIHYISLDALQDRADAIGDDDLNEVIKTELAIKDRSGISYKIAIDY